MSLDSVLSAVPSSPRPDASGLGIDRAPSDGIPHPREIHSDPAPWIAEGVSRATWYRRTRPQPEAVLPMRADVERWYCVRAVQGQERHADIAIRLAGFTLFAPTILKLATPPRRDSTGAMRPGKPDRIGYMFGAYMFVSLNLSDPDWSVIKDVDGVDRVMTGADLRARAAGVPVAVPDSAIAWVQALLEPNGCMYPKNYPGYRHRDLVTVGTAQRMLTGALTDQVGICEWSDHRRARLLFNLLGREVSVTVERATIEAV